MLLTLHSKVKGLGQPVVLLHGLFGASDNLGSLSGSLSRHYQVHSLDLRNHGNSPHSDEMNYRVMAEDVRSYIVQHQLDKVHLLGHSMGGKVAMQLALSYPELVQKLIVADIAPVDYPAHHASIFEGLLSIDLLPVKSRSEVDQLLSGYIAETSIRQLLLKNLKRNPEGGFSWKMNLNSIHENYHNIMSGICSNNAFGGDALFIAGGLSDYLKLSDRNKILSLFPQAKVRVIPETSHWLHVEKPKLFAGICERFLKEQ